MRELVLMLTLILATSGICNAVQKPLLLETTNQAYSNQTSDTSKYNNVSNSA